MCSHELDRLNWREPDTRDVCRRVLRDEGVERLVEGPHVALLEQGLSDVRASKRATLRDLEHAIEIDRVAEPVQLLDHELDATASVLAEPSQPVLECRVRRINEVPEDVRVSPLGLGVELGRWDDAHP